jgi:DNA-directed RNA polymerase subunit RPC12/RpoP
MTQPTQVTCPNCGSDRIETRARGDDTVADDYICLACGHKFDLEDIARQIIKKTRKGDT